MVDPRGVAPYSMHCLYPQWAADLSSAGFADVETWSFDVVIPYTHESWRGRMLWA